MLFIVSILILFFIFLYYQININTKIFSNDIIGENEFKKIITEKQEYKNDIKIYYNDYEIPYNRLDNYYILSTDKKGFYLGNITNKENYNIKIKKTNFSKKEIIEKNENIIILLYKELFKEISEKDVVDEFEFEKGIEDNFNLRLEIIRKFYSEIYGKEYENDIKLEYDYDILTDYFVFINLINSIDNIYKNEKILFERQSENIYTIKKTVWDLDWSIYNEQVATKSKSNQIFDTTLILFDTAIPQNIRKDDRYLKMAKNKYFEIKREFYNTEYINNLINEYDSYLKSSGALMRNNSKKYEDSIKNIRKYFEERMPVLDNYFGGL